MKCLYVSDLDGTLLRSDETISEYTKSVINRLTQEGMIFSYATARSLITAKKVTQNLEARIPLIVYNGAFIMDNVTGDIMISNYFEDEILKAVDDLIAHDIYPLIYAFVDQKEKFSFIPEKCTEGMKDFLRSREGDVRTNSVKSVEELKKGNIFYLSCMDDEEKLRPFYEKYKNLFHCVFQRDIYTNVQWLEMLPKNASKSNAIKQLKEKLGCDKLVVFGDGKNDIDMFELADEAYAVENGQDELKEKATAIIASNNEDGVAKWLEQHFRK